MIHEHAMSLYIALKAHDDEIMSRRPEGQPRGDWRLQNPAGIKASFRIYRNGKEMTARINYDTAPMLEIYSSAINPKLIDRIDLKDADAADRLNVYTLPSPGDMRPYEFKAIRERLGLTQKQLAPMLELGNSIRVSEYERDTNPRKIPGYLARLMLAYDSGYRPSDWPK